MTVINKISAHISHLSVVWKVLIVSLLWIALISWAHYWLNFDHSNRRTVTIGYMPVITNMAAPLLDEASKQSDGVRFKALKFASFAEMAESLRNGQIDVGFMIAPLSIVLNQQGEDVRIVYIGNRHESTLVTRKDLKIKNLRDLEGKTVAVPMRFSGHNLSILQLIDQEGLNGRINVVEMNPPDMASALATGALDAYYVGEPFAAQTLQSGDASLLFYVEDVWKYFICNLAVVRQKLIDEEPEIVKTLVTSAARSGIWASQHPDEAAKIASKYWNQPLPLVKYALNTPDKRIVFDHYEPKAEEMQYMADLMVKFGLTETNDITGLVEPRFARDVPMQGLTADVGSILPH